MDVGWVKCFLLKKSKHGRWLSQIFTVKDKQTWTLTGQWSSAYGLWSGFWRHCLKRSCAFWTQSGNRDRQARVTAIVLVYLHISGQNKRNLKQVWLLPIWNKIHTHKRWKRAMVLIIMSINTTQAHVSCCPINISFLLNRLSVWILHQRPVSLHR